MINQVINDAQNAVSEIVALVKKIAEQIQEQLPGFAEEIINKVKEHCEIIQNDIKELAEKAKDIVDKVSQCVLDHEGELGQLEQEVRDKMLQCVEKQVKQAKEIITKVKKDIQELKTKVVEIFNQFKGCGVNPICFVGVVSKLTKFIDDVKSRVAENKEAINKLVESLQNESAHCIANVAQEAAQEQQVIAKEIADCVENAIKS